MSTPIPSSLDSFPVDLGSSAEFLVVYVVIGVLALAVGKLVSTLLASALDRSSPSSESAPRESRRRAGLAAHHERFTIGFLPHEDELLGVGYLKASTSGVANALLADAISRGWLVERGRGFALERLPESASQNAADLAAALRRRGVLEVDDVLEAANETAVRAAPAVREDLLKAGLLRPASVRTTARFVMLVIVGVAVLLGLLRALRLHELAQPFSIVAGAAGVLLLVAIALSRVSVRSDAGDSYIAWLDGVTGSLRADVASGRSHAPADIVLAAALVGLGHVAGFESLAGSSGESEGHHAPAKSKLDARSIARPGGSDGCGGSTSGRGGGCGS